jgi:hypothetical protein
VNNLAASLHAQSAVPLEFPGATLYQVGAQAHNNFTGTVYVAASRLLAPRTAWLDFLLDNRYPLANR